MQRDDDVGRRHQSQHVGLGEHGFDQPDIVGAGDRIAKRAFGPLGGAARDQLDHQHAIFGVTKGAPESGNGGQRVLARESGAKVYDVEHDQGIFRQGACSALPASAAMDAVRHAQVW